MQRPDARMLVLYTSDARRADARETGPSPSLSSWPPGLPDRADSLSLQHFYGINGYITLNKFCHFEVNYPAFGRLSPTT